MAVIATAMVMTCGMAVAQPAGRGVLPQPPGAAALAGDASRDRIVDAIQRKYNARVVKVTEAVVDGRRVLELRLLSNERVWVVRVDAESGREM
jgi:hypothetical protein